jgi:hypothetical protein
MPALLQTDEIDVQSESSTPYSEFPTIVLWRTVAVPTLEIPAPPLCARLFATVVPVSSSWPNTALDMPPPPRARLSATTLSVSVALQNLQFPSPPPKDAVLPEMTLFVTNSWPPTLNDLSLIIPPSARYVLPTLPLIVLWFRTPTPP